MYRKILDEIGFIAGRWAHIDRRDTNTSRVWE